MKIDTRTVSCRIQLHSDSFIDVTEVTGYGHDACEISALGAFNYSALIKKDCYDPIRLIVFPNKKWFDEWYEELSEKPEIIYSFGKESSNDNK